jgi:hypothetical protein
MTPQDTDDQFSRLTADIAAEWQARHARHITVTVLAVLAGLALELVGIATKQPLVGVAGFVVALTGAASFARSGARSALTERLERLRTRG